MQCMGGKPKGIRLGVRYIIDDIDNIDIFSRLFGLDIGRGICVVALTQSLHVFAGDGPTVTLSDRSIHAVFGSEEHTQSARCDAEFSSNIGSGVKLSGHDMTFHVCVRIELPFAILYALDRLSAKGIFKICPMLTAYALNAIALHITRAICSPLPIAYTV